MTYNNDIELPAFVEFRILFVSKDFPNGIVTNVAIDPLTITHIMEARGPLSLQHEPAIEAMVFMNGGMVYLSLTNYQLLKNNWEAAKERFFKMRGGQ